MSFIRTLADHFDSKKFTFAFGGLLIVTGTYLTGQIGATEFIQRVVEIVLSYMGLNVANDFVNALFQKWSGKHTA